MAVWKDLIIESFWCLSRQWADVDWSLNVVTDCSLFTCPHETSMISDVCAHFMRLAPPKIVKHLQAIKRVNYDQDIKSDTSINRRSRTSRRAYFDVSLGRKICFTIVLGATFLSFFLRSHQNWFHWPMNKCRTGRKRLVIGKLIGKMESFESFWESFRGSLKQQTKKIEKRM